MVDLDSAGGAASAGLVANAVERPTGHAGEHTTTCTDCGAEASGRFCSNCGQPTHIHRTLGHLLEELLHGVVHFDSRIWRTLPLLVFRPGRLTREWVQGRRTRYVSPLALFLFTVFLMFFILSFLPVTAEGNIREPMAALEQEIRTAQASLKDAEGDEARAAAELRAAPDQAQRKAAEDRLAASRRRAETLRDSIADDTRALSAMGRAAALGPRNDGLEPGSWQAQLKDATARGEFNITGDKDLDKKVLKKLQNPELALYKLQQTFYKFAFLLVPLSIPFVALLFLWKRGFTLYDHGVFVLYSLTFIAMLTMALFLLSRLGSAAFGLATTATVFIVPAHQFFQLKGAYGLSAFSALWRTILLLCFCSIVLTLFIVVVILLGFGG
jgi:uncharacterized membrane protein (DUF106 family)